MKFLASACTLVSLASSALAHTTVQAVWLNGSDKGAGALRRPPNNNPVKDVSSGSMYCNWAHEYRGGEIIASSHKGPIAVYISKEGSNSWVKIDERGNSPGSWATDVLISNGAKHWVQLPALQQGRYLVRAEWITLHESDTSYQANPARGAQIYIGCAQVEYSSGGSVSIPAGVAFPGAYSFPAVTFNVYAGGAFPIPGPAKSYIAGAAGYGIGPANSTPNTGNNGGNNGGNTGGSSSGNCAAIYGQCGGAGFAGASCCAAGRCVAVNQWYSQCQ
ncbi:hypothetical protein HK097_003839 [Rhizophlyctis rosea]|uniref:AA9 family lytic polysaccharide monooxygenase n=1 Tax=Rhizophlyctis rosea TaxID=64517 RepID=A0AAD5SGE0_9FUNG|nr:hypothetical protein HK097_003839 [Rhizophlyctis rosea]